MSANNSTDSAYLCSNIGLLLPFLDESKWGTGVRAILYLSGLLYSFLGVAIAADLFMCAIEKITSKKRRIAIIRETADDESFRSGEIEYREVEIWNPTVANLTLMALGSSAPEILLSIIEIVGGGFKAGKLGPGTIVGSAAFNLLGITAVCIYGIPNGEVRRIDQIYVFITTASFSLFAYIWLLIVLLGFSPDVVELWEAILTFLFFIAVVVVAYLMDIGIFTRSCTKKRKSVELGAVEYVDGAAMEPLKSGAPLATEEVLSPKLMRLESFRNKLWRDIEVDCAKTHPDLKAVDLAALVAKKIQSMKRRNRLDYRIMATRWLSAMESKDQLDESVATVDGIRSVSAASQMSLTGGTGTGGTHQHRKCFIEFEAKSYGFTKQDSLIKMKIIRRGRVQKRVMVTYETANGSASRNQHFLPKVETIIFQPGETEKQIVVDLLVQLTDDVCNWTTDMGFFVRLSLEQPDEKTMIGTCNPTFVRFCDESEEPPKFHFAAHNYSVRESEKLARLPVVRLGNPHIPAVITFTTQDLTAQEGKDYLGGPGELKFEAGEMEKLLDIIVIDDAEVEKDETFMVEMKVDAADARLGPTASAVVTIISDDSVVEMFQQLDHLVPVMLNRLQPDAKSWKQQLMMATSVNGGDTTNASMGDLFTHIAAFPWKVIFAFIPPPCFCGGWLTFFCALGMIGLLTAVVGDLAGIFGCLVGLEDTVTAITLVAMGTSLPDLFASKLAASQDSTADNAIGNVTGSNSVNVFLGLGLPWLIAAAYWQVRNKPFEVPAGDLSFSVAIFTITAIACLALLAARRKLAIFGCAELGGPVLTKTLSAAFLVILWFLYVLLSSLKAYKYITGF